MLKASDFFDTFNEVLNKEIEREFHDNAPVQSRVRALFETTKAKVALRLITRIENPVEPSISSSQVE